MKIYSRDDRSLVEYYSTDLNEFDTIRAETDGVQEYARFSNANYDLVAKLEEKITKHGHLNAPVSAKDGGEDHLIAQQIQTEVEGYNMMSLFSLAKVKPSLMTQEDIGTQLAVVAGDNILKRPLPPSTEAEDKILKRIKKKKQRLSETIEINNDSADLKLCVPAPQIKN
jgi:hypothetical protein